MRAELHGLNGLNQDVTMAPLFVMRFLTGNKRNILVTTPFDFADFYSFIYLGSTVPVGNKANWNGRPSGWDFPISIENQLWIVWYARKKLAVEIPIKFKCFTILYGSKNLYI